MDKAEWGWEEISKIILALIFLILIILVLVLLKDKLAQGLEAFKNMLGLG